MSLSEYKVGSILSINCMNFLTFDNVKVNPGPFLNVVIGPNGTGKSSLVCAICIGLGANHTLLGRAGHLTEFIQHGKKDAKIEIELYTGKSSTNNSSRVKITRLFTVDKKNSFMIDGKEVRKEEVTNLVKSFGIHLENLTTFLPQDQVSSFSALTPNDILKNTIIASGQNTLIEQFNIIRSYKDQMNNDVGMKDTLATELQNEIKILEKLQPEVKKLKQYKQLETTYNRLKHKRNIIEYNGNCQTLKNANAYHSKLLKDLSDVKTTFESKNLNQLEDKKHHIKEQLDRHKSGMQKTNAALESVNLESTKMSQNIDSAEFQLPRYEKEIEELKVQIIKNEEKINMQKSLLKNSSLEQDSKAAGQLLNQLEKSANDISNEINKKRRELEYKHEELRPINDETNKLLFNYKKLTDLNSQKRQLLKRKNYNAYRALEWLDQNKEVFQAEVLPPLFMDISVKNPKFISAIEKSIPYKFKVAFLVKNEHDSTIFVKKTNSEMGLKINAVSAPSIDARKRHEEIKRNRAPIKDLNQYGLLYYLDELIECSDEVRDFLNENCGFLTIAVGNQMSETRSADIHSQTDVRIFYTDKHKYVKTRSSYDPSVYPISVEAFDNNHRDFFYNNINQSEKNSLENALLKIELEKKRIEAGIQSLEHEIESMENQKKNLLQSINMTKETMTEYTRIQGSINHLESQKKDIVSKVNFYLDKIKSINANLAASVNMRADKAVDMIKLFSKKQKEHSIFNHLALDMYQIEYALQKHDSDKMLYLSQIKHFEEQILINSREITQIKDLTIILKKSITDYATKDPEAEQVINSFTSDILTLSEEIIETKAKYDAIFISKGNVIQEFQAHTHRKVQLEQDLIATETALVQNLGLYDSIFLDWKKKMEALVVKINAKFTSYFGSIQCKGHVKLDVDDIDVKNYGISIFVSFRANENPKKLMAYVQSGGEKSVATIIYLMSLQQFGTSPFRLVDEINQGMDKINERRIFNIISKEVGEKADDGLAQSSLYESNDGHLGQYFYITPKLLKNLDYSKKTTVLCVFNNNMNEKTVVCDLSSLISSRTEALQHTS